MSSNVFAVTLDIRPRPSRILLISLLGIYTVTGILLLAWIPQWWAVVPALLILSASFTFNMQRHVGMSGKYALSRLVWQSGGAWKIFGVGDQAESAELLPGVFVTRWLVVLNFRIGPDARKRSVLLCRDSLDETSFRRLRVRLRLEGSRNALTH